MRHGSLFSGIGGFDLAAEWMGWENVFHCEWNPFGQRVLKHYWPNAETFTDITKTDFKKYANTVDIISGGFPCQPFSLAGKRKGTDDERYLWGEMLRAIQEIKPRFVIAENVFGITNIDGGLVFEQVCLDLENEGYEVQPFIIPAAAKNAPHRRDRCWFIGVRNATDNNGIIRREGWESQPGKQSRHGESNESRNTKIDGITTNSHSNAGRRRPCESGREERETISNGQPKIYIRTNSDGKKGDAADAKRNGLEHWNETTNLRSKETTPRGEGSTLANDFKANGNGNTTNSNGEGFQGRQNLNKREKYNTKRAGTSFEFRTENENINGKFRSNFENFPTQPPICGGDDGLPTELDGITFSKWRAESIKAYGNAIVPQVAYEIFKAITKTI